MDERSNIITKIRALRAKASNEASSEAEVVACMTRVSKLIAENEISEHDLREAKDSFVGESKFDHGVRTLHPVLDICITAISKLSDCKHVYWGGEISFIGGEADREFAIYLAELVKNGAKRAYTAHWKNKFISAPSQKYSKSYYIGFGRAVAQRMYEIAENRHKAERQKTGTDLVVLKNVLVEEFMDEHHPNVTVSKGRVKKVNPYAYEAGIESAQKLNINRPFASDDDIRKL